jgi:hypothetical protein
VNPAVASAGDASSADVSASTSAPSGAAPGTSKAAVGAAFRIAIVAASVVQASPGSQTRSVTDTLEGPSRPRAENVGSAPAASNDPSLSRSHANVTEPPSESAPDPASATEPPSSTVYGPPASALGARLSSNVTTARKSRPCGAP